MKKNRRKEQLHKRKHHVIMGFFTTVMLLCCFTGILIAKYYAGHRNKGVVTASGLYFTSNLLKDVRSLSEDDYPVIYNTNSWDGTNAYRFDLEIRNYQNQLLYNDRNLNITYEISFQLAEDSDGGTYQITYQSETKNITKDQPCSFQVELQGGRAMANHFELSIAKPNGNIDSQYRSVGVLVEAVPVSPEYVTSAVKLGGIIYAGMFSSQLEVSGSFSKVPDNRIGVYAAFPYTITYKPGMENGNRKVKVSWNSNLLQLDMYSSYYSSIKDEENGTQSLELELEPYTVMDLDFYRTGNFDNSITWQGLNQLVTIEDKGGVTP